MNYYRKKPVTIEAELLTLSNIQEVADWVNRHGSRTAEPTDAGLLIKTLEGEMRANFGDYVIRGVAGEFYPCKPDIFERTYDLVEGEEG